MWWVSLTHATKKASYIFLSGFQSLVYQYYHDNLSMFRTWISVSSNNQECKYLLDFNNPPGNNVDDFQFFTIIHCFHLQQRKKILRFYRRFDDKSIEQTRRQTADSEQFSKFSAWPIKFFAISVVSVLLILWTLDLEYCMPLMLKLWTSGSIMYDIKGPDIEDYKLRYSYAVTLISS